LLGWKEHVITKRIPRGAAPKIYESAIVMEGAEIGSDVMIGAFCFVAAAARIGSGTRIQSHTSIWDGVTLEENVFVGPAATFTNVKHPRVEFPRAPNFDRTLVERGASIGAAAVLVAPVTIGSYAMIGAGAVVTKNVPAYAIVIGNPARVVGWACECGETISKSAASPKHALCTHCGAKFPSN
jgi:UDP-2-acetamido-3-amino-2,3-dideoxy-glucuronate N-acetyltransferase